MFKHQLNKCFTAAAHIDARGLKSRDRWIAKLKRQGHRVSKGWGICDERKRTCLTSFLYSWHFIFCFRIFFGCFGFIEKKILRQIINSGYSVFIFLNIFLIEENWTPDILRQSDGQLMRDVLTVDSYCSACISKTVLISSMWSSISNYIARRLKILFISFN